MYRLSSTTFYLAACIVDVVFRRKKRDTSSTESETDEDLLPDGAIDPLEDVEIPGPEGLHPNDTWPTASGITLQMATSSCETPIRALPIFGTCDPYTLQSRQAIIQSCILDIQVSLQGYCLVVLLQLVTAAATMLGK